MTAVAPAREDTPRIGYSRVTLIGRRRRADLVLPSGEAIGALLPGILSVLDEPVDATPNRLGLATAVGDLLAADDTLIGAGIDDGAVLLVVSEDEVPPPPVVNDVTEETAADLERRAGRWSVTGRRALTVTLLGALAALASAVVVGDDTIGHRFAVLGAASLAAWLVAAILAWACREWLSVAMAVAGSVGAIGTAVVAGRTEHWLLSDRLGVGLCAIWMAVALAAAAWRTRGPFLGGMLGVVLGLGWIALRRSALTAEEADAIAVVVCVVALGMLPRWALSLSGLTRLDDRRMAGEQVSRRTLERSLLAAHAGLAWAATAAAAQLAVSGTALAHAHTAWPIALSGAAAVVTVLRARSFPLAAEVAVLVAAAAAVTVVLVLDWVRDTGTTAWPLVAVGAAGVGCLLTLSVEPAAHVRARLRSLADRTEAVAVLALIPLLIGVFGVFGRLLHSF